jgi:glutamate synthase (NADPH/NADH) small chain
MEKRHLDRRLEQMKAEGVQFVVKANVGADIPAQKLLDEFDAVCLCGGSTRPRDLPIEGRNFSGIVFAMDYLTPQNRRGAGDAIDDRDFISARGKDVIIIGGGDTGADCLGTVHRQGSKSVHQFEIVPRPPDERALNNPWPQWSNIFRVSSAHEEGGHREYSINTKRFHGENGAVCALETVRVELRMNNGKADFVEIPGSERVYPADLVLLAMGFVGPEKRGLLEQLGVELDRAENVKADSSKCTNIPKVFTAGDMTRGQSLIVWAIAEGRQAAHGIDQFLMGSSDLPAPLALGRSLRPFV